MSGKLDELEKLDREITEQLKGPLNNVERAWLVADRKELRKEIAHYRAALSAKQNEKGE